MIIAVLFVAFFHELAENVPPALKIVPALLSVRQPYGLGIPNSDADFLGISQAEAEMLRKLKPKIIRDLQIVPIRPAITTAKCKKQ